MRVLRAHHTIIIEMFSKNAIVAKSFRDIPFCKCKNFFRHGLNSWTLLRAEFLLVLIMMMTCRLDDEGVEPVLEGSKDGGKCLIPL